MTCPARLFPLTIALVAYPSFAQAQMASINVPAAPLAQAVHILSRQSGASIGFRDTSLAHQKVKAVHGQISPAQALEKMLRGTDMQVKLVAPRTFLIERRPHRKAQASLPSPASRPPPTAIAPPPIDIIVTGSKRDIPLGFYPGGVEIVDGSRLSSADAMRGTAAIESRLASVVSTHLGPGRNKLFIRGIADSSFVGPTQATVGQYWGNSRVTYSAPDPNLKLYDVGRIEVLEGPQGTLYGAGSLGGVVRVIPNAPTMRATQGAMWAGAQAIQHGKPGFDGGALINLPLAGDELAFRAIAFGSAEGGYIDNAARSEKDVNSVRTFGGRAALRYQPDALWTIDISGVGQRIDGDDSQYAEQGGDRLTRHSSITQPYRNDFWLVDVVASKRLGSADFTTSLGYASQYMYEQFEGPTLSDVTNSAQRPTLGAPSTGFIQTSHIDMLMAEARLSRHGHNGTGWLLGLSFLRNDARVNRQMEAGNFGNPLTGVRNRIEEATLYGEAGIGLTERLILTTGGRLTYTRLSGNEEDSIDNRVMALDPTASAARSETRFLPSLALVYRPNETLSLFARYQQGFRPGGISVRREYIQRYTGDRVGTGEIGARYQNRTVEVSANASWTDWRDIQADLIDGFGFPTTSNIGDGRVFSLGLSTRWHIVRGLEISASAYFNDSKVTTYAPIVQQLTDSFRHEYLAAGLENPFPLAQEDSGRLPNIADITARIGFSYLTALSSSSSLEVNGHARYIGKSTLGIGPVLGQLQGDYVDTGLELKIGTARNGWTLSLTNLLDTRGNRFALGSPFLVRDRNQITPLHPRSIRIGYERRF